MNSEEPQNSIGRVLCSASNVFCYSCPDSTESPVIQDRNKPMLSFYLQGSTIADRLIKHISALFSSWNIKGKATFLLMKTNIWINYMDDLHSKTSHNSRSRHSRKRFFPKENCNARGHKTRFPVAIDADLL